MSKTQRIICEYCGTSNPWEAKTCLACGGPITRPPIDPTPSITITETPAKPDKLSEEELLKIGGKADDVYFTVLNTYAIAWRIVGEAISIALTAFILGFVGVLPGCISQGFWARFWWGWPLGLRANNFIWY